ncbi:MAG: DNA translocase FtsK [Dehalococcoidia bacterium]
MRKTSTTRLAVGTALAVGLLVALLLVNPVAAFRDTRDWLLQTFGLGLAIMAALGGAGAVARWRKVHRKMPAALLVRRVAGIIASALFAWGLLGFNRADWSLWGTDFRAVTLGGETGAWLVGGFIGTLTWLALGLIAALLLQPRGTIAAGKGVGTGFIYALEHRWPQRAAGTTWRIAAGVFDRRPTEPRPEEDIVIGVGTPMEEPRQFEGRPALVTTADENDVAKTAEADGAEASEPDEPEEPTQLGLDLEQDSGNWHYPALDLLNTPLPSTQRKYDNQARAQLIVDTLASFGVDASVVEVNEGPTVTQFGVEPGWEVRTRDLAMKDAVGKTIIGRDGRPQMERVETSRTRVRVNKITALQNDLALALAAPSLRIEAPVPGRAIVGIEVPNDTATVVTMRSVMETKEFSDMLRKSKLAVPLGRGVSGVPVVADLAKMPHLLIAGATGSGKSVCVNTIISGIMMNASPEDVRFVLVDPKRVELTGYGRIPHLAFSEVIVDVDKVVGVLQAVVAEMESRYKKFAAVAARNIESYNKHPRVLKKLPYWVVVIDELADLMMVAPFEVEKLICRLAQLARATGIHLVVATQRPSVDVVTGLIKANFPTRIAFAVTSMTDSRTILDTGGAEKLLGRGDMLFMPTDAAKPIRIQGVYLSDAEVERIVEFWADDRFAEFVPEKADNLLEEALVERNGDPDIDLDEDDDPLLEQARELAAQHSRISPSLVQRRLRVGYVKACRIIEALESEGIVSGPDEGESRRVLAAAGSGEF